MIASFFRGIFHVLLRAPICVVTTVITYTILLLKGILQCCGIRSSLSSLRANIVGKATGPTIFFDGGGWGFAFALGVVQHIRQHYSVHDSAHVFAISAGNIAALCLLLDVDPAVVIEEHFAEVSQNMLSRPVWGFCDDLSPVKNFLESWLPEDVHHRVGLRYGVIVSWWPSLGFTVLRDFRSKAELIDAVLCSCGLLGFVWAPRCLTRDRSLAHDTGSQVAEADRQTGGLFGLLGCLPFVDGAYQNFLTPVDDCVDIGVRPYAKNRPGSLVPSPGAYHPRYRIQTYKSVVRQMSAAKFDASQYTKLQAVLKPFTKVEP